MKSPVITLLALAFTLQAYSQAAQSYLTDFGSSKGSKGFVDGASLLGDWTTTNTSLVVTRHTLQSGSAAPSRVRTGVIQANPGLKPDSLGSIPPSAIHPSPCITRRTNATADTHCDDLSAITNRTSNTGLGDVSTKFFSEYSAHSAVYYFRKSLCTEKKN